mmetsp:Transcript_15555/g.32862  ORF Transcript_15555/g.32862 Transcript_15555/m.32862 type:complete len:334 (+) Transcript_15555:27-1028(+)
MKNVTCGIVLLLRSASFSIHFLKLIEYIIMKLSTPFLLLGTAPAVASDDLLDLFVREKYFTASNEPCDSCAEGDGCYLRTRSFFLRGECFNRNYEKSSVYDEVTKGVACRRDFRDSCESDEDIIFDAEDEDDCRDTWNLDECSTGSERMRLFDSWCTYATGPSGEYTVPLLTFQEFDGENAAEKCGSAGYSHLYLPNEGGCIDHSFLTSDGEHVDGSRAVSCDGNVFNSVRYQTDDCTGDGEETYLDGSSEVCPESSDAKFVYTNNCGAPTIYCKEAPFFGDVGGDESSTAASQNGADPSISGSGVTTESAANGHAAVGSVLSVGMALMTWIV